MASAGDWRSLRAPTDLQVVKESRTSRTLHGIRGLGLGLRRTKQPLETQTEAAWAWPVLTQSAGSHSMLSQTFKPLRLLSLNLHELLLTAASANTACLQLPSAVQGRAFQSLRGHDVAHCSLGKVQLHRPPPASEIFGPRVFAHLKQLPLPVRANHPPSMPLPAATMLAGLPRHSDVETRSTTGIKWGVCAS